uniref:WAP four-disulfide core domain 6B n=1 Tax=Rattus norvegicus TaxID=10116 RepID=A0ABK0LRJ2_RAT
MRPCLKKKRGVESRKERGRGKEERRKGRKEWRGKKVWRGKKKRRGITKKKEQETCPKYKIKCDFEERSQCSRHKQCPEKQRCCMFACGKKCLDLNEDICSLPQDAGPCLAYLPRWWYNKKTNLCTQFIYGGCQGNTNNFLSKDICTSICTRKHKMSSWI